jgi:hypothetical protein
VKRPLNPDEGNGMGGFGCVGYLLYLHGSNVAFAVLELDEQREPEAGRALVHTECYVLPAVLAGSPGVYAQTNDTAPVSF